MFYSFLASMAQFTTDMYVCSGRCLLLRSYHTRGNRREKTQKLVQC